MIVSVRRILLQRQIYSKMSHQRNIQISPSILARGKRKEKSSSDDSSEPSSSQRSSAQEFSQDPKFKEKMDKMNAGFEKFTSKVKSQVEQEKANRKFMEESWEKHMKSESGKEQLNFLDNEMLKVAVPLIVILCCFQLFTGANNA
ncbi:Oidioi.mRNA.OKI2018_I69.chr1.g3447.t1.cds [Oikopleura dioica]|uniref:Oidioi.mRNA.OKI2018_I69.chr1.g3447.t1.cds n=1 Tax=Oikopleura dioica TaxID=34765 RepID=A0ABN7SUR3_OIKDI|nr:Oidioi.mRNA.OKI2018_I69.chr1.g3447.t1.cds [Oikopleura dioica]